jgi:hypothetical protein
MQIPTGWSIYKKVRLSIQNSEANFFTGKGILEGYCRQRAAPPAVLSINSLRGKGHGRQAKVGPKSPAVLTRSLTSWKIG